MAAWNTRGIQKRNFTSVQLTSYWQSSSRTLARGTFGGMEDSKRHTLESGRLPKCGSPSSVFVCK